MNDKLHTIYWYALLGDLPLLTELDTPDYSTWFRNAVKLVNRYWIGKL
jgi:hypothetical protein